MRAAEQILADRAGIEKIWRLRLERAQIDVDRARRCYRLAEPENRLVARALEKDWEAAAGGLVHGAFDAGPAGVVGLERMAVSAVVTGSPNSPGTYDNLSTISLYLTNYR